jgi:hypothetical protein
VENQGSLKNSSYRLARAGFAALLGLVGMPGLALGVWITESHYDNESADADEFIEVAGAAGTDLTGWSLVLYNGSGGAVYDTIGLSGSIPDQSNGFGTLSFAQAGIQNGSPDGVALANGATLVQFLSYEGAFSGAGGVADGVLSTDIGVAEDGDTLAGHSLQLGGAGTAYADFAWQAASAATPGAVNTDQRFPGGETVPAGGSGAVFMALALGALGAVRRWLFAGR